MAEPQLQHVTVYVTTDKDDGAVLVIEPWGDGWDIARGDRFCLVFRGPSPGEPEIVIRGDGIEVWGWGGSDILRITKNGDPLLAYERRRQDLQ
jgi:hypothetical protein